MRSHRWKVLGVGFAANACFSVVISGMPATAVMMRDAYGMDTSAVGMALSATGFGIAVSEVPWGVVTDKLGDRRVLLAGLVLTALVLAIMAFSLGPNHVRSWYGLVCAFGLIGLFGGSLNGASGRAVMAWFDASERGFAMSIRQAALPLGGMMGALLLPAVVTVWGFAVSYALLAALCALCVLATWVWLYEPPTSSTAAAGKTSTKSTVLKDGQAWRMVVGMGLLCVPQIAVLGFCAVFLHDVAQFDVAETSAAIVIYQLGAAVLRVWSGRWTDRNGNRQAFLKGCCIVTGAVFLVLAVLSILVSQWPETLLLSLLLFVVIAIGGMIGSCWHGVAFTELAVKAGPHNVGTALGLGNTLVFASYCLTPLWVPLLVSHAGWPQAWSAVAACALLAIPLLRPKSSGYRRRHAQSARVGR